MMLVFFCLAAVFPCTLSGKPPPGDASACELNFTSYDYKPTGECIGPQEKIKVWDCFPTTLCCEPALTTLSQAMAQSAHYSGGNIFLDKDHWSACTSYIIQQQTALNTCHFENFFSGSSQCSSIPLSEIRGREPYKKALTSCADFRSSYDDVCSNCSRDLRKARDDILASYNVKDNDTEREICGVAVITSIAAEKVDDPSFDAFYNCLPTLRKIEPGYIKIRNTTVKVIFPMVIATIVLVMVIILIKYVTQSKQPSPIQSKELTKWSALYRFSKAEIDNAINFSTERKCLGRGSAGQVYKGILPSGQVVAIKHINKSNTSDSFTHEVEGLSRVRHPNLACLFGYCIDDGEQYLVYEYCAGGNLAHQLLRKDTVLTWEKRVKILRDCALALRYLHNFIDGCIVHRDIKLTNILLTENLEPKLSDFGLAKMLGMQESKVFTDVRGTIGYMDPEYMSNAKLTCASDIYSFGIVALQILSGQKVIELDLDARDQLTRKAKDVTMGKRPLSDFEDPRLNGNVNINIADFESILHIAVFCVAKLSKDRPKIDFVFEEIDKVWKNTVANKKSKRDRSSTGTPMSKPQEAIAV